MITHNSPLDKRPLFIGLVVSGFGMCACFTPIMGGALTEHLSWRWCFWMFVISSITFLCTDCHSNLPVGGIVTILVLFGLSSRNKDEPARNLPIGEKLKKLDPLGATLLLGSMCCLFLALQWGGSQYLWNSSIIIGLLVGFASLFILFGISQWWLGEQATIPPHVVRKRTVFFGALSLFFISASSNIVRIL